MPTDAWSAGHAAGYNSNNSQILTAIEPPAHYSDAEKTDFILGFIAGQNHRRDDDLISEMQERNTL